MNFYLPMWVFREKTHEQPRRAGSWAPSFVPSHPAPDVLAAGTRNTQTLSTSLMKRLGCVGFCQLPCSTLPRPQAVRRSLTTRNRLEPAGTGRYRPAAVPGRLWHGPLQPAANPPCQLSCVLLSLRICTSVQRPNGVVRVPVPFTAASRVVPVALSCEQAAGTP